jgi:hypothetical protein
MCMYSVMLIKQILIYTEYLSFLTHLPVYKCMNLFTGWFSLTEVSVDPDVIEFCSARFPVYNEIF